MGESKITKRAMAGALIDLCKIKPFNKISVQDITKKVGLNRQTFYYHFNDKNDLLCWIYQHDAFIYLIESDIRIDNWEEQALKTLKKIKEKDTFYLNTVQADINVLLETFYEVTHRLFINLFNSIDREKQLSEEDKEFYSRFFSYGCGGVLTNWILNDYQETPLAIAAQLFRLAKDTELFSYRLYCQNSE